MDALRTLGAAFPEAARDVKLNLQGVLQDSSLAERVRWGVALASAYAARNPALREAVLEDGGASLDEAMRDDAQAAAVLMAMNNVFYRFRHLSGNPAYATLPPRLRMNRIASPKTSKVEFELLCLAVSAIHNCETCVRAHERVVLEGGLTPAQVQDAIRIAATIHAAAVALEVVATPDAAGF